jgi:hypothetical protein
MYKFIDALGNPLVVECDDEDTANLFAQEMNLKYVGKADE